jgi:4-hydroxybenzoate polyprenyltransferase/phosphoserine phosphatase
MKNGGSIVAPREDEGSSVPRCVDLDGTLVHCDLLVESLRLLARERPWLLLRVPLWLAAGRARLKEKLADAVRIDAAALPYNELLLEHLRRERARGRRLLLVTASHERPAREVANHVGLFDEVIATGGRRNLKGRAKRRELVRRFGERGFDYAGDSGADLAVWTAARQAIAVNASASVLRRLGDRANRVIGSPPRPFPVLLLRALRVRQWVKNLLVFLPVVLAHRYLDPEPILRTALAFLAFSLGASAVYVLNDLLDLEADRHHPEKRHRPFASGELSPTLGFALVPLVAALSVTAAWFLPRGFLVTLLFYFLLTTLYSFRLKKIALLDVIILASLFTTRIIAGSEASGIEVSEWLLGFSMFLFFSLAAVKRYAELLSIRAGGDAEAKLRRRGYFAGDHELILQMGISSGFMAVVVLALFVSSESVTKLYPNPTLLWFACPLVLYWIGRIWLLAHRGEVTDDPLMFAVRDRVTWIVAILGGGILIVARGGL